MVLAMIDEQAHKRRQHLVARYVRILVTIAITTITTKTTGSQASLMNLPDGIENVLGFVPRSSFQCQADGYFGDIDNDCRLFHLCQRQVGANGRVEWRHWTYACGNQTMFNQLTLTCAFVDEAIPCRHASQFQYLNEVIHKPAEPFLTDADVTSGFSYYSNRVMSDGARARAFHDSQLLSQIGGQQQQNQFESPSASNSLNSLTAGADDFQQVGSQFQQVAPTQFGQTQSQFQSQSQRFQQQTPHQPQRQNFEFRETLGPAHPQTPRAAPSQNSHSNLIEEHAFQLQHQAAADAVAANSQQLQSLQNFGNFAPPQPQQPLVSQSQPQPQQSSAGDSSSQVVDVVSSSSRQQTFAPAPVVDLNQPTGSGPSQHQQQSFEFSIATNHQPGAGSGEQANEFFNQVAPQQRQQKQQQQHQFANEDELRRQFAARLPPPAESVAPTTTTTAATTTTTLAAQTTVATASPLELPRSTSAPIGVSTPAGTPSSASSPLTPTFTSSQRLAQVVQPTPATSTLGPAPTTTTSGTTTTTTTTTTTAASASTTTSSTPAAVELRPARRAQSQQQQVSQTGRRASSGRAVERTRTPGFQSTRLSSQQKRQAVVDNSPIVMRKPVVVSSAARELSSPATSRDSALVSLDENQDSLARSGDWSTGGSDFWRRSFDAQLMAPKFESLLLRRRV